MFTTASMIKPDRTVIHVEIKESHEHYYFGSLAAMYEDARVKSLLGIAYQTFRTKGFSFSNCFENDYVIVRKGKLMSIPQKNKASSIR